MVVFTNTVYKRCLTDSIVATAAEDSGRLSWDPETHFDADELLDPDFPMTGEDDFEELSKPRPSDVLEDMCGGNIKEIVRVTRLMEDAWENPDLMLKSENVWDRATINKLWHYGQEYATLQCEEMEEDMVDFVKKGNALFNRF